jgi:GMP synthase-like glutamine amidotransferase
MYVHYLQHVPYEGVGLIEDWAETRGHELSGTLMFAEPSGTLELPDLDELDLLVIMGGPMNVYEHDGYPWLTGEKDFIRSCISRGKDVLGICLGAQLIADVLGGEVTRAPHEEIGWYPVELTGAGRRLEVFAHFPDRFTTLQWHGDTFSIPPGATHAAFSEAVPNQAFTFDDERVIGLQFHLEETLETLEELIQVAGGDLPARSQAKARGPWVSPREDLLAPHAPYDACRELLFGLLDRMVMR